ncbi:MAG: hypothetical protein M3512_04390 [Bacteroidota bacterium]|nr:hypothetical protein [Bacteroidota bacterium]
MKHSRIFDIIFIIISAVVLVAVNYLATPEVLGKFSLIVAMVAYFIGKYVKGYEIKKRH